MFDELLQEELKKSQQEKELVQQRARLYLADEQLLQSIASVQQLPNMESELEQALEGVSARKIMDSEPSKNEVLSWSTEDVAMKVESLLGNSEYEDLFRTNCVDGQVLLMLGKNDLMEMGVKPVGHRLKILQWIAQYFEPQEIAPAIHVNTAIELKSERPLLSHPKISSNEIPSAISTGSSFSNTKKRKSSLPDPGVSYERIFKKKPSTLKGTGEFWGKAYLAEYHPFMHRKLNQMHEEVRSWFNNKDDPQVKRFFMKNLRHDRPLQQQLKDFIGARYRLLPQLHFANASAPISWEIEDIFHYVLENKHGWRRQVRKNFQKNIVPDPVLALSEEDKVAMTLCQEEGYEFELQCISQQTTTHILCCSSDQSFNSGTKVGALSPTENPLLSVIEDAITFATAMPREVIRQNPYKAWLVKITKLEPCAYEDPYKSYFIPAGEQFKFFNVRVSGLKEGDCIEVPAVCCRVQKNGMSKSLHDLIQDNIPTAHEEEDGEAVATIQETKAEGEISAMVSTIQESEDEVAPEPSVKSKVVTDHTKDFIEEVPIQISKLSNQAKLTICMFVMGLKYTHEVYPGIKSFMAQQNAKVRTGKPFVGHKEFSKEELVDYVTKWALEGKKIKIVDAPLPNPNGLIDLYTSSLSFL